MNRVLNTFNRLIKRFSKEPIVKNEGHTKFAHVRRHRYYTEMLLMGIPSFLARQYRAILKSSRNCNYLFLILPLVII